MVEATKVGLGLALNLSDSGIIGQASDRPIGIRASGPTSFTFDPKVIRLDYAAAEWLVNNDPHGKGKGVLEIVYRDDDRYHGVYSLFVQVSKIS